MCIIAISIFIIGCNNEGAGCFDKAGEIKSAIIDVPTFTEIDVNSNIDVKLVNIGNNRVEVTTGENLIAGITLKVENGILKIDNLNTCFWSTGYTHPIVTVRNPNLLKIVQHGYGTVYSKDTLFVDKLSLQIEDASGGFDLILNANEVSVVSNNIGPITLSGGVDNLRIQHSLSDGIFFAKKLKILNCTVIHNGSNRMELNVIDELKGSINSIGDIYLFNQRPSVVNVAFTSTGSLIENY